MISLCWRENKSPYVLLFRSSSDPVKPAFQGNIKNYFPTETSFENAMKKKSFFADKSRFIQTLGDSNNIIFTRPRRFGKSLVLQILKDYFDKNKRDQFDTVFGSLWIGEKDSGATTSTRPRTRASTSSSTSTLAP